ncbi:SDR family oxidoreductase [Aspergillus saccharolyticus JOP 1030-1]|uniref:Putative cinnamoyl-CoA reductase n=1 Tax=Aspergillus saccharolyticus JOP 1030-1 TaxID=1450539 RepID=A0A318ZC41_9EURO|nr:putative cinnamoyl-CoA reductase [Aspergillus saccharolyticus JOP 1030-1]PYH44087.1 putative cinnamoyl-CoA reductase [Aspergillus saccharolyticus JOP 1030-1]
MSIEEQIILITGASGFVATQVVRLFLQRGYRVRGTVRSEQTAEKVRSIFPEYKEKLSFAIVQDIAQPGAFDEAVKGVQGIIHTASPFQFRVEDNERDLLQPAIRGTRSLLEATQHHAPQVKRVVLTSSFAAINHLRKGYWPEHTYTEADWNPDTYEEARTADGPTAYCASKTLAEKAAWEFVETEKPNFTLATICPPMIYGPVEQPVASMDRLNESAADVYRFMNGSLTEIPATGFPAWVDVRDVAEAHLRAYEAEQAAANERFFVVAGNFFYDEVCEVLRGVEGVDKAKVPVGKTQERPKVYGVSNEKVRSRLGMEFYSLEASIRDTAESLLKLEKKLKQ